MEERSEGEVTGYLKGELQGKRRREKRGSYGEKLLMDVQGLTLCVRVHAHPSCRFACRRVQCACQSRLLRGEGLLAAQRPQRDVDGLRTRRRGKR